MTNVAIIILSCLHEVVQWTGLTFLPTETGTLVPLGPVSSWRLVDRPWCRK